MSLLKRRDQKWRWKIFGEKKFFGGTKTKSWYIYREGPKTY